MSAPASPERAPATVFECCGTRAIAGLSSLLGRFDGFIVDQWGVLHDGVTAYPGAIECLRQLRAAGKHVVVLTDARFSGVSTGACIGHVGPEALAGGPIGKVRDGDRIQIIIDRNRLEGWRREGEAPRLRDIEPMHGWVSPRLGLRFDWTDDGLRLIRPDGRPLETYDEVDRRAEAERLRAEAERQRAERLAERLRALGVDPEAP